MGEPVADKVIWPVLVSLAECLCTQITDSGLPEPCFCGILSGTEVAFDHCTPCDDGACGQAWVRINSIFPSKIFPNPDFDNGKCVSPLAFEIVMGIVRCAPTMDDDGNPPTMEAQFDTAQLVTADAMAMRRAIACCADVQKGRDYVLGQYLPVGPEGGCVGGLWTAVFSQ